MKNIKFLLSIVIIMVFAFILSGCPEKNIQTNAQKLIGTWQSISDDLALTFFSDGTGWMYASSDILGSRFRLTYTATETTISFQAHSKIFDNGYTGITDRTYTISSCGSYFSINKKYIPDGYYLEMVFTKIPNTDTIWTNPFKGSWKATIVREDEVETYTWTFNDEHKLNIIDGDRNLERVYIFSSSTLTICVIQGLRYNYTISENGLVIYLFEESSDFEYIIKLEKI